MYVSKLDERMKGEKMRYADIVANAIGPETYPELSTELKFVKCENGNDFPVLLCLQRQARPIRNYGVYTKQNCPLCKLIRDGCTYGNVVSGMEWLPAKWPIKQYHGICYPRNHRAGILNADIISLGRSVDKARDAVACINFRNSAASVPNHLHAQLHDFTLPGAPGHPAFPLLSYEQRWIKKGNTLALADLPDYPAFAFLVMGSWEMLGHWLTTYLTASNMLPHNFAVAPDGKMYVIPRRMEKAPSQENKYGASEMLGLITPVTREGYNNIDSGTVVAEALSLCGMQNTSEQMGIMEHAIWAIEYLEAAVSM